MNPGCYHIFGASNSMSIQQTSVNGESGWFILPRGFFAKPSPTNNFELMASPNSDFSRPVYYCVLDDSMMNYAFQDLWLQKLLGIR